MIDIKYKLTGDAELDKAFRELSPRLQKKVIRPGLAEAAKIVHRTAYMNAPVITGQTRQALRIVAKKKRNVKGVITLMVLIGSKMYVGKTYYAAFVEFGHRLGKRLRGSVGRLVKAVHGDTRPFVEGKHFIERAYKSTGEQAKAAAIDRIKQEIEKRL